MAKKSSDREAKRKAPMVQKERLLHASIRVDAAFVQSLSIMGWFLIALVAAIAFTLFIFSWPAIRETGLRFVSGSVWNPVSDLFGSVPFLVGTLLTSLLALVISIPFVFSIAILLGDYFPGGFFSNFLKGAIDLTAAVPSVIFGFWGFMVLVPLVRKLQVLMGVPALGVGILPASLVLAVMVIPYAASLAVSMVRMVPSGLKEGAYALGATRWEVLRYVILPSAGSGIGSGFLLALGRAIGETMAVTMVIGNANLIPGSIFSPGNTMASLIANEFSEADRPLYLSSLIEIGLMLFVVTFIINIVGKKLINRIAKTK